MGLADSQTLADFLPAFPLQVPQPQSLPLQLGKCLVRGVQMAAQLSGGHPLFRCPGGVLKRVRWLHRIPRGDQSRPAIDNGGAWRRLRSVGESGLADSSREGLMNQDAEQPCFEGRSKLVAIDSCDHAGPGVLHDLFSHMAITDIARCRSDERVMIAAYQDGEGVLVVFHQGCDQRLGARGILRCSIRTSFVMSEPGRSQRLRGDIRRVRGMCTSGRMVSLHDLVWTSRCDIVCNRHYSRCEVPLYSGARNG